MSLSVKNIFKNFEDKQVLNDFSYNFSDRGIYALMGESGIGKTTLLRIIAGLEKDYRGEVIDGGVSKVSFCFQEHRLFPELTAIENVVFAISDGKDTAVYDNATELLLKMGLGMEDISLLPEALSGGMKQRVSIARALMKDTPILLLDEPTKELDPQNASVVRELIYQESKKRLVILVSHNKEDSESLNATIINL